MLPIREMLEPTGLTEQQWRVLRVLTEHGAQDASTVATRACLLFPSLTRIARTMQDKGLITQTRDTEDRRRQIITITPEGQAIIDGNTARAAEIVREFKATLGDERYEQLLDLLALLDQDEPASD
jgi:homoprotocatechuate degradation regulator HpaR